MESDYEDENEEYDEDYYESCDEYDRDEDYNRYESNSVRSIFFDEISNAIKK